MDPCWENCVSPEKAGVSNIATIKCLECLFQFILAIVVRFAGIAVFIMLLIGGFKYLTSGGDPKAAESARNTLTYAVLGFVLLLLGWFIFQLIEEFTGVQITIFRLGLEP